MVVKIEGEKCTVCGGTEFTDTGTKLDRQGRWQMRLCHGCGHKQKGELLEANKI